MNIEEYRDYCLSKKGVTEETPFGPDTLVFKVMGKMFALSGIENFEYINLKCDPDRAINLRESHEDVRPGYHMNKKLWNSVYINGDVSDSMVFELINHSYDLVVNSLTKKLQAELEAL
ncbi:MAG: MmcQ/YjbR family DNA-binding protein [Crocinitomicaceae bacterium]